MNKIDDGPTMQTMLLIGHGPFGHFRGQKRVQTNGRGPDQTQAHPIPHFEFVNRNVHTLSHKTQYLTKIIFTKGPFAQHAQFRRPKAKDSVCNP